MQLDRLGTMVAKHITKARFEGLDIEDLLDSTIILLLLHSVVQFNCGRIEESVSAEVQATECLWYHWDMNDNINENECKVVEAMQINYF